LRNNKYDGLTAGQRTYIRRLNEAGSTPRSLAIKYGVATQIIDNVLHYGDKR